MRVELNVCDFTNKYCPPGGNFDFFKLYYCGMGGLNPGVKVGIFIPFALFLLFIFFYILSDTADEYLSPALERITGMTGISESLAGVTLLAFGNGAPDIFASISSASSSTVAATNGSTYIGDNSSSASSLIGSTFFVTGVVQAMVTRASVPHQSVKVTPVFFLRDLIALFIALTYLLVHLLFIGYINLFSSIGFFILYSIFVVTVVITNKREAKRLKAEGNGEEEGAYYKAADFLKTMSHAGSVSKQDAPF